MAVDIRDKKPAPVGNSSKIIFEYWLDTEADIADLPPPGREAANTSVAYVKSTGRVLGLGEGGWSDLK